uniref:C-type lectin domain-containing protein n=1 Tax=Phasianus colchicus TaxID=9054 RepID=A0A669PYX7_PHACC
MGGSGSRELCRRGRKELTRSPPPSLSPPSAAGHAMLTAHPMGGFIYGAGAGGGEESIRAGVDVRTLPACGGRLSAGLGLTRCPDCFAQRVKPLFPISQSSSVFTVDPREVFAKKSAPPAPLCPQPDLCVPLCPHMAGAAPHLCTAMGGRERLSASPQREQFMLRYRGPANCWLGLHRAEGDEHWTWADGSAFTNWFEVRGGGRCAYLNGDRISSALCHTEKLWVCSRADSFILWRNGTNPQ